MALLVYERVEIAWRSDRTRSAGHSLTIKAAPEEKERGKEFNLLQFASLVILLKIR